MNRTEIFHDDDDHLGTGLRPRTLRQRIGRLQVKFRTAIVKQERIAKGSPSKTIHDMTSSDWMRLRGGGNPKRSRVDWNLGLTHQNPRHVSLQEGSEEF